MGGFGTKGGQQLRIHGLRGSAGLFHLTGQHPRAVIVAKDEGDAFEKSETLRTYAPRARIVHLPELDSGPFSFAPVHPSVRRTRLQTFHALEKGAWDYLVVSARSLIETLPGEPIGRPVLELEAGGTYDLSGLAQTLVQMGYNAGDIVSQPGDFARRGGILDIYSFVDETAYRLEFFDDELEEIRTFDSGTQRGTGYVDEITILPLFEWIITEPRAETFNRKGGSLWNQTSSRGQFLELVAQVRDRGRFSGYLHWTPLFFEATRKVLDYVGDVHIYIDDWDAVAEHHENFITHLELQMDALFPGIPPAALFRALYACDDPRRIPVSDESTVHISRQLKLDTVDIEMVTQNVPHYQNDAARFFDHWRPQSKRLAIVVVCRSDGMRKRFEEMLEDQGRFFHEIDFPIPEDLAPGFYIALGHLETGFSWPDRNLVVISERDVFSKTGKQRARAKQGKTIFQSEFRDLRVGDHVVHLDHGVGKFLGLVEMEAGGATHEMMALAYRGNQKLYVNLNQLDLIQRYGSESAGVQLDKLGSVTWTKAKARIKKAVRQMAGELLQLYAERKVLGGRRYAADTEWQREFEDAFEYEPTEGQLRAIADIKTDLESDKLMDRLLVGDVGFGKTEVAMRLAFKAVMEGLQVAVLCPTTVLAFQHYHTFRNRFSAFPVRIGMISRFTETEDARTFLDQTANGQLDILIGTHRLFSKDVQFENLGVLIIDEEQRFGVAHKEKLKKMRKQVDVLSMSATPIPRSLNMSMTGIRDISVIETPPRNRLAISTTVAESRENLIRNAIEYELERNGQVYFIHNRIETMDQVAASLRQLVPQASFGAAHGQMDNHAIEKVMLAFMRRKIDVLIASTIIENGVDIPNANTMIVNRADLFGMSQLYQLRGRIGRSDRPAYAFLLVPPRARMSSIARKRLATLEEFSELGAGFRIAAMDLELRGAGNLLGAEQAGHINAIGYETYLKLLEEAVGELEGKDITDEVNCLLRLDLGAAIPKGYIQETNQRLHYYKRIASAKTLEDIDTIRDTLRDVYGPLPTIAEQLCEEHRLRLRLSRRRVLGVERKADRLEFRFHGAARVDSERVLAWVSQKRDISVTPEGTVSLPLPHRDAESVMAFAEEIVDQLIVED